MSSPHLVKELSFVRSLIQYGVGLDLPSREWREGPYPELGAEETRGRHRYVGMPIVSGGTGSEMLLEPVAWGVNQTEVGRALRGREVSRDHTNRGR